MVSSFVLLHRSFLFELKQQVLSGAFGEAIDMQTSVVTLLAALQGLCALKLQPTNNDNTAQLKLKTLAFSHVSLPRNACSGDHAVRAVPGV